MIKYNHRRPLLVHKVQMTDGKRNIIRQLVEEYNIESAQDIQEHRKYTEKFMSSYGHGYENWPDAGFGRGTGHFKGHGHFSSGMGRSPFKKGGIENDKDNK